MTAYDGAAAIELVMFEAEHLPSVPEAQLRQRIGRALKMGGDRECLGCVIMGMSGGPVHAPSPRCLSGGRPHCTCDTCF